MMGNKPLLIFIAGPYSNQCAVEREANVNRVHRIVKELMKMGHFVLECHSLEHSFFPDSDLKHVDFLRQTLKWLEQCDALFLLDNSPGANLELRKAHTMGIPIYRSLDEVPNSEPFQETLDRIDADLSREFGMNKKPDQ